MAIPDFQTLMLPLLKFVGNGQERLFRDAVESIAQEFSLTEAERAELLPSRRAPLFYNRLAWAKTYLKRVLGASPRNHSQRVGRGCCWLN